MYNPLHVVDANPWCDRISTAVQKSGRNLARQTINSRLPDASDLLQIISVIGSKDHCPIVREQIEADAQPWPSSQHIDNKLDRDRVAAEDSGTLIRIDRHAPEPSVIISEPFVI
jgi:hypothetical protein